jgi:O-antigen ligase
MAEPGALGLTASALAALGALVLSLMTMGIVGMVGLADYQGAYLVVLPMIVLGAFLSWLNERIWIYIALLGHFVMFLSQRHEGIGAGELGFTALSLVGLCVWLFKELVIHRRVIVRTGFDALLIGVFVATTLVALVANRLHQGDLLHFMSEWTKLFDLFLYFPVRKIIRTRRDVMHLLVIFAILGIANGVVGVLTYRERLMTAVFAYQIEHSRVFTNEPVSMLFAIMGAAIVAYAVRTKMLVLGVVILTSGLVFLVITFSRGAIASAGVGIIILMILSGKWRRLSAVLIVAIAIAAGGAYLMFPRIAKTMATSVGKRIGSIGSTMSDVSFNLRKIEAEKIMTYYVPYSPIIGHGYGVRYTWYDPTEKHSANHSFIHNGYIRLIFKHGYPLAVFFLFFLVYPLLRLLIRAPSKRDRFLHGLTVGCVAYLITTLVNNYVSDMFSHYSGPLNYVLCWAILDYVNWRLAPTTLTLPPTEPAPLAAAGA